MLCLVFCSGLLLLKREINVSNLAVFLVVEGGFFQVKIAKQVRGVWPGIFEKTGAICLAFSAFGPRQVG